MKIVTWNCNMAFRKKAEMILKDHPDIVIVQECEHPEKLKFKSGIPNPTDVLWFGHNKNKGLGIFSYSDYKFSRLDYNPNFKLVVPVSVYNQTNQLTLYAIWANNPEDREGRYVTQVWKAINHYDRQLSNANVILIGDFNSNTIWDKPRREGNHSTVVKFLEAKGIRSVYHHHFKQQQGKEKHPTFHLYRQKEKPYHIDYCFVSAGLLDKLHSVKVGSFTTWSKLSDHHPLFIRFK
ncbi:MAG TPA: endonuclease/exonuclease/phosphatase family protein [Chitinophagaceae bacterium]